MWIDYFITLGLIGRKKFLKIIVQIKINHFTFGRTINIAKNIKNLC